MIYKVFYCYTFYKSLIFKYLQIIFVFSQNFLLKYFVVPNISHTFASSNKQNDKQVIAVTLLSGFQLSHI